MQDSEFSFGKLFSLLFYCLVFHYSLCFCLFLREGEGGGIFVGMAPFSKRRKICKFGICFRHWTYLVQFDALIEITKRLFLAHFNDHFLDQNYSSYI